MSHLGQALAEQMLSMLRAAGLRVTAPRRAVVWALAFGPSHSTAMQLLERASAYHPALGRASVYRTLEVLSRLGAVRPWAGVHGEPEFVRVLEGHHHLMCSYCGELEEMPHCGEECPAEELTDGSRIHGHLVELIGVCASCAQKEETCT